MASLQDGWGSSPVLRREPCFFVALQLKGAEGNRVPWFVSIVAQRKAAACPGSRRSRYSHLTSSFVHVTRTSQREHVGGGGFKELSAPPAHWDAWWLSKSTSSSSLHRCPKSPEWRTLSWSSASLPPLQWTNNAASTTWSQISAQETCASLSPRSR